MSAVITDRNPPSEAGLIRVPNPRIVQAVSDNFDEKLPANLGFSIYESPRALKDYQTYTSTGAYGDLVQKEIQISELAADKLIENLSERRDISTKTPIHVVSLGMGSVEQFKFKEGIYINKLEEAGYDVQIHGVDNSPAVIEQFNKEYGPEAGKLDNFLTWDSSKGRFCGKEDGLQIVLIKGFSLGNMSVNGNGQRPPIGQANRNFASLRFGCNKGDYLDYSAHTKMESGVYDGAGDLYLTALEEGLKWAPEIKRAFTYSCLLYTSDAADE